MRILLVEDNVDHRELMSLTLTGHDPTWQVEEMASEEDALLRLAEEEVCDLVFLDYSLPGRNGLEVLEGIRRGKAPPPVVMVTGRGDEQMAVEAMKGGAYDYVAKGEGYLQRLPVVARRAVEAHQSAVERKRAGEERERLLVREREQRQLAETLIEITNMLNSSLDREQVLQHILEQLARVVRYDRARVTLVADGEHEVVAQRGFGPAGLPIAPSSMTVLPHVQEVLQQHHAVIISDTATDARWHRRPASEHIRCWMGVPMIVRERIVGLLNLDKEQPDFYTKRDAELAVAFADQAAIAVENARLYEQARQDAETKSTLLQEVNHRVKNNLCAIVGLLCAEQRYADVADQAVYRAITQNLINRVGGLATVHSLLSASEWAPLPLSDLAGQVIRSSLQMLPRDKGASVEVTPSQVQVTPDQAHDLALVINELATNTVRHALQERDTVHIIVRIVLEDEDGDETVRFEFRDDGLGYPEDVLRLERYGVGFDLIQNAVRRSLRGKLSLHNDRGAVAVLRFKAQA